MLDARNVGLGDVKYLGHLLLGDLPVLADLGELQRVIDRSLVLVDTGTAFRIGIDGSAQLAKVLGHQVVNLPCAGCLDARRTVGRRQESCARTSRASSWSCRRRAEGSPFGAGRRRTRYGYSRRWVGALSYWGAANL